ncbi:MAG: BPSS1780 family membrane protein [Burkholderiales bacterium]
MKVRDLSASHGWQWVRDAFKLFARSPMLWIALTVVLIVIWMISGMIPILGQIAIGVLYPVFMAGLMAGARKVDKDDELELADLFTAFRENLKPLATVGVIGLVLQIMLLGAMMLAGFKEPPMPAAGQSPDVAAMQSYLSEIALPLLIGAALWVPIAMALWFVPPLLMFNKHISAVDAIKWSFYACVANIIPFLVYGLVMFGLSMLMPFTLFLGVIVLIPVIFITMYTAYKDIFDETGIEKITTGINPPKNA